MASPWAKPRSGGEAQAGRLWRGIRLALALDAVNERRAGTPDPEPLLTAGEGEAGAGLGTGGTGSRARRRCLKGGSTRRACRRLTVAGTHRI